MELNLEALGITKEEVQNRVIDRLVEHALDDSYLDWDDESGDEPSERKRPSKFAAKLHDKVQERVDAAVAEIAEKHILPNAAQYIENVTFQPTNRWGEKQEKAKTFREYLAERAENYLTEPVDFDGQTEAERRRNGASFSKAQTRITSMVHKHLHYEIERIMKEAVQTANSAIAKGIQESVKIKLEEIVSGLKVSVQTK
jgi:hypothetical protein